MGNNYVQLKSGMYNFPFIIQSIKIMNYPEYANPAKPDITLKIL